MSPRGVYPRQSLLDRFWAKVKKTETCWLWTAKTGRGGYGRFNIRHDRAIPAHRFSWELMHGPVPNGLFACHRCDTPACVRPDHLFVGTQADNIQDAMVKGRLSRGEHRPHSKLTAAQVSEIRHRHARGELRNTLAKAFGVSWGAVDDICNKRKWRHVP